MPLSKEERGALLARILLGERLPNSDALDKYPWWKWAKYAPGLADQILVLQVPIAVVYATNCITWENGVRERYPGADIHDAILEYLGKD